MEFWYYINSRSSSNYGDPGAINVFLMQSIEGDKVSYDDLKIVVFIIRFLK